MRRFFVQRDKSAPPSNVSALRVGETLFTGEDDFASGFSAPPVWRLTSYCLLLPYSLPTELKQEEKEKKFVGILNSLFQL